MKRALIVLAFVLAAAILGGILVPALPCPDCGGASRTWGEPHPERAVWIGCPACVSRGRVTGLRRLLWKPLPVAKIARETSRNSPSWSGEGRLVQVRGTTYGLVCLKQTRAVRPGTHHVKLLLLDSAGLLVDQRDEACSTREGTLAFSWVDPSQDGAVAEIGQTHGPKRYAIDAGRLTVK